MCDLHMHIQDLPKPSYYYFIVDGWTISFVPHILLYPAVLSRHMAYIVYFHWLYRVRSISYETPNISPRKKKRTNHRIFVSPKKHTWFQVRIVSNEFAVPCYLPCNLIYPYVTLVYHVLSIGRIGFHVHT